MARLSIRIGLAFCYERKAIENREEEEKCILCTTDFMNVI